MTNVQMTDDIFDKRSPEKLLSDADNEPSHGSIDIQLKISAAGAYRVYDDFYEEDVTRNDGGTITVTTTLTGVDWIYNYLLSFGPILEGIKPQSLCNKLKDKMQMMMQNFS